MQNAIQVLWFYSLSLFAITAAKSRIELQTNLHNTSSNTKKQKDTINKTDPLMTVE